MCAVCAQRVQLFVGQRLEQEQRPKFVAADTSRPSARLSLCFGQVPVHQHHCHRPFADGGCHPLRGFGSHITCNKHTGHTCFQMVRRSVQRPAARRPRRSGPDRMKPWSSRATTPSSHSVRGVAPMKQHIRCAVDGLGLAGPLVEQTSPVQMAVAAAASTTSVQVRTVMFVVLLDLLDEVVRHRRLQRRPADQHGDRLGRLRHVHRGLAGRVGAADDVDVLAGAIAELRHRAP